MMVRTQIQLTESQTSTLKHLARQKQVSMAELIRQSVDLYLATQGERSIEDRYQRALTIAGKYQSEVRDLGRNHDDYLAQVYAATGDPLGD